MSVRVYGGFSFKSTWFNPLFLSHLSLSLLSLGMFIYRFAKLALAAATLFGQSVTARTHCSKPSVRREWRSLTSHERAEWIAAVKVNPPSEHPPSITDTSLPSVSTHYLTALLWYRPSTQPTPRSHPSTPAVHISTVRLYPIFTQILLISYRNRLVLYPYGSQSRRKSLLDSPYSPDNSNLTQT